MITNTAFILLSLYSQMIFIINKQHHNIVFLPKHKGNALYIKKKTYTLGRLAMIILCHCVVRLQFLITVCYLNILMQRKLILNDMVYTHIYLAP